MANWIEGFPLCGEEEKWVKEEGKRGLKFLGWGEEMGFYGCGILSPCGKRLGWDGKGAWTREEEMSSKSGDHEELVMASHLPRESLWLHDNGPITLRYYAIANTTTTFVLSLGLLLCAMAAATDVIFFR